MAASLIAAAAADKDQHKPHQLQQAHQQRRHIGQRRGPQHLFGAGQLILIQQARPVDGGDGPGGGVELHRQRHQLEQRGEGKQHDADEEQRLVVQHQPHQQQDEGQAGTDPRGGDDGRAQPHRPVVFRVLDSVARLVGRQVF